ncbi:MAG TPA: CHC2 zinc finger domain-containing protein [Terriglobales bacterium]|nr:CHC2 zinc finger domain-containing protein [Terriglobales bacterium]
MANPGDFAYTVKQQADIVRIVGEYIKLRKSGAQNFVGVCPFHNEKTGSFSVHATRQFYHCFGCGVSGDVFSFVQKIENITFPEAVRVVAQKLGIAVPKMQFSSPQEAAEAKQRTVLIDLNETACQWFQEQLRRPEAAAAREYLKSRGLDQKGIELFRIGFAPESGFLLRDRLKGEAEEEALRESGLFSWKETQGPSAMPLRGSAQDDTAKGNGSAKAAIYSKFRNRIMFPICNESGKVIAFTGRTLATDEKAGPKYLNSPETAIYSKSRVLYNLHHAKEWIRKFDYVILVEGQMDCISVYNAGFQNVIASSGTAFTEFQVKLLKRFTSKIVVNFDPDTAGAAAAERSLGMLVSEDFEIKVMTLEQGFDPDLYVRKKGRDAYAQAVRKAPRYFDYLVERARTQFPVRTPEGKAKAVNYLLPHIQRVQSRIVRDELATEIANKLQIDNAVLRQELKHVAGTRSATKIVAPKESPISDSERVLIRALATARDLGHGSVSSREGQDLDFEPARQAHYALTNEALHVGLRTEALLGALLKSFDEGSDPMSLDLPDADRSYLAEALMKEDEEITAELLESAIEALRRRKLEARQRELKEQIAEAERKSDAQRLRELIAEKLELDRHLRSAAGTLV